MKIFSVSLLVFEFSAVFGTGMESAISSTWAGIKERNNVSTPFLIHRPFSEYPNDAVSEGFGYGLIVSYYVDEQDTFNALIEGAESTMWNGVFYDWRVDQDGNRLDIGGATDAEQDIAMMMILAQKKVDSGSWRDYKNGFYGDRAYKILQQLWSNGVENGILRPGYGWGGEDFVNPGYFAPAWYRMFNDWDPQHDWNSVVNKSYEVMSRSPGVKIGLVPDWMTPDGEYTDNLGYNAYGGGHYFYKDAIRILWRIGTDWLWNREPRAYEWLWNAKTFLDRHYGGIRGANFFTMDGFLLPENDQWVFDGGDRTRYRREHSPLTIGMWMIPYVLIGTEKEKNESIQELLRFYTPNQTFWGKEHDDHQEDILHNEMYFDQFLALFGALMAVGWFQPSAS